VNRIKTPGVSGAQSLVAPALPVMARELRVSTGGDQLGSDGLPARRIARWLLLPSGALSGIGSGLAQAATTDTIIESVPASQTGIATSVNAIVRTIGGSLGSAARGEILTSHAGRTASPPSASLPPPDSGSAPRSPQATSWPPGHCPAS
jgi:hypothetical protein